MDKQDILTLISNVVGVEPEEITIESDFLEDLNCEPKDMFELKLQLEDLLKLEFDEDKFKEIETVGDLYALIEDHSNEFLD